MHLAVIWIMLVLNTAKGTKKLKHRVSFFLSVMLKWLREFKGVLFCLPLTIGLLTTLSSGIMHILLREIKLTYFGPFLSETSSSKQLNINGNNIRANWTLLYPFYLCFSSEKNPAEFNIKNYQFPTCKTQVYISKGDVKSKGRILRACW